MTNETSSAAEGFVFSPPCANCGRQGVRLEVLAPAELPRNMTEWSPDLQAIHRKYADPSQWRVLLDSVGGGNGVSGHAITPEDAADLRDMLDPFDHERVRRMFYDGLGFCTRCGKFYCGACWGAGSYGWCPKGHGKSLDPHYS